MASKHPRQNVASDQPTKKGQPPQPDNEPAWVAPQGHRPSERVLALYSKTLAQLDAGHAHEAADHIRPQASSDPILKNALGVALLRAGQIEEAVKVYRQMVMTSGGLTLRSESPTVFKSNFATALMLDGKVAGAESTLDEIRDESHPAVQKLRAAIAKWRSGLSLWQRVLWRCGIEPNRPVPLDFPPGDLT